MSRRIPTVNATEACAGLPPGGEGVGTLLGEQPEARHRQAHALAEALHDGRDAAVNFRVLLLADRLRAVGCEGDFIREEVTREVHQDRQAQAHVEALAAGYRFAGKQQKGAEQAEQENGFDRVRGGH